MAWVRFKRRYDWRVPGGKGVSFLAYPAGRVCSVKRRCAEDAIADGAAEPHAAPRKGEDPNRQTKGDADGSGSSGS